MKSAVFTCSRTGCGNKFIRLLRQVADPLRVYCSRSCAAKVNNVKFPKRRAVIKDCRICGKKFRINKKYCSRACKNTAGRISSGRIVNLIRKFFEKEGRIPLKTEFSSTKAARLRFGSWNKAIIAAGYNPNPIKFAKKCVAKDGHKCDSLAEKIIDDWLFRRKIKHKRSVPYPTHKELKADFLIGDKWVEFFGLTGQIKKYDTLKRKKTRLAKKLNLDLIQLYPLDLFVNGQLEKLLLGA